jgi:hypothetical protein
MSAALIRVRQPPLSVTACAYSGCIRLQLAVPICHVCLATLSADCQADISLGHCGQHAVIVLPLPCLPLHSGPQSSFLRGALAVPCAKGPWGHFRLHWGNPSRDALITLLRYNSFGRIAHCACFTVEPEQQLGKRDPSFPCSIPSSLPPCLFASYAPPVTPTFTS